MALLQKSEETPEINFQKYKDQIEAKGFVEDLEKKYPRVQQLAYLRESLMGPEATSAFKESSEFMEWTVKRTEASLDEALKKLKTELDLINAAPPLDTMTVQDAMKMYPEETKIFEENMKNHKYSTD